MRYHYVWLVWSVLFLLPWAWLYLANPGHRKVRWRTSLVTAVDPIQMLGVLQAEPAVKAVAVEAKAKLERVISSLK